MTIWTKYRKATSFPVSAWSRANIYVTAHREENIDSEDNFRDLITSISYCVLSDSGTLSEETAMLGFAGVLIRTSTERPEVLDKGTVIIGGIKGEDVEQSVELAVAMRENHESIVMAGITPIRMFR